MGCPIKRRAGRVRNNSEDYSELILPTYREISRKLSSNNAVSSVTTSNLSPNSAELRASLSDLSLVYEGNLLAKVEVTALLIIDTIDFNKGGVVVGVAAPSAKQ